MLLIDSLTKRFSIESGTVHAVDGLSMRVAPGEVFGLLGPNGAGKTTTLRMVLGLLEPDDGFAEVAGIRTSKDPFAAKAKLGFVSASDGVYPWLSVREMLLYFADLYGVAPQQATARLKELASVMQIEALLDRRAGSLSTGQRQRVTLVRGLIHDPPVMLLDEPTRGLDVVGVQTIFEYIEHLRAAGKAVVVCTHRLDEAERLCDQFGLLHRGRIRYRGTLNDLREETGREHLVEMFVDLMNSTDPALTEDHA
ncbi:ATP-binding cassette domain-containing protein [Rhodopirellula baltica]|uniref:Sodium ABC transporter ATP-binding protein n=3 Tax=Rhodopirellula baltica TaxID=265606 RepID=Q7UQ83_RHOBA|nr:ATP-binding cassette domain-containing protein [Rhodopirellula baltica]EGF26209.1 sodium ABC transporter ATP-binding protein [Rhodopirellula baltica WH47]EKK00218.1 sodium ABC transporter ATP-binding protein [Rhodopirellula baltica SH28]CAD74822.1 sodium ABC transporter ATP-binding protein [Rhodopirellula baltica SH 1]HBE62575.1 sodium ABC transporter ATP-binding protein [Rhodopirellula baltica]